MDDVLIFATVIAPIVLAFVELVKRTKSVDERYLSLVALALGLTIGVLSAPFSDLEVTLRLWSGALAGLASVGLFELSTTPRKEKE